jgi:RNA polymerase sigma factor (sigma-70 family)
MEQTLLKKSPYANADAQTTRLLADFREGDVQAFSKLYNLYVNLLFSYGCKLTSDTELLKDCIQEVFVKIYNMRTELDSVANFKSYVLISLKNKLCDESRKRVNLSSVAVEDLDVIASDNIENDYIANEREALNNIFVTKMLDQLSPRQRKAIILYYIEEKKYEDICVIMQMNYQSVRNLIHRGISKLRVCAA